MRDISDGSDTNFIYMLPASESQQHNNEEHFKTNKTPNKISLFTNKLLGHVTIAAGIEVFLIPKKTSFLVKDCSRETGSIQEHSLVTILAPVHALIMVTLKIKANYKLQVHILYTSSLTLSLPLATIVDTIPVPLATKVDRTPSVPLAMIIAVFTNVRGWSLI